MYSLATFSIFVITYQAAVCLILSWFILGCQLHPSSSELNEMTLLKLLYLYDPQSCNLIHFYNFTTFMSNNHTDSFIIWITANPFATTMRKRIKLSLALHILWLLTGLAEVLHKRGSCSFYAFTVPFTLVGVSILVTDVVSAGFFVSDAVHFQTIFSIMDAFEQSGSNNLKFINVDPNTKSLEVPCNLEVFNEDTSWVGLVMAWFSMRGLVQWMLNYWIVADTYMAGLKKYKIHSAAEKAKRKKSYYYSYY